MSDTQTQLEERTSEDIDDLAHFTRRETLIDAIVYGKPVIALCGRVFVPSKDPEGKEICSTCKVLYEALRDTV